MGVTVADMATLLGLSGANASDRVREMERGAKPISGPMVRVLSYLAQGVDMSATPFASIVPRWLACLDLEAKDQGKCFVMHTQWPRFVGWIASSQDLDAGLQDTLQQASIPMLPLQMPGAHLVILYLDEPPANTAKLLQEATRLVNAKSN